MSSDNKSFKKWIKDNENKWICAGIITISFAIATPFIIYFVSKSTLSADSFSKLGTVGDFLGGTTVGLLSLASILFLISTIVMQRKELGMQREELQMTREELVKANQQYEITNETMLKQQFETTFFNMINMHNSLVDGLTLYNKNVKGKDVFIMLHENINNEYRCNMYELFIRDLFKKHILDLDIVRESYAECCEGLFMFDIFIAQLPEDSFIEDVNWYLEKGCFLDINDNDLNFKDYFIIDFEMMLKIIDLKENFIVSSFNNEFIIDNKYKKKSFDKIMIKNYYILRNYYKSINTIFDFVKNSNLNEEDKKRYLTIFCSQFNPTEITFIHYEIHFGVNTDLNRNIRQIDSLQFENGLFDSIL